MKHAIALLVIITCLPLLSLLTPGLPVTHDGQDHVARIASFYLSLKEGNIVPRWGSNLNWGFGHPILMFLYPLPSYTASLFHTLGFSFVDSTKLVFALSFILSVIVMYCWIRDAWGNTAGIVSAVLYGFAPYRFVDLYVRGALGEHVAFIFLPMICWGLYGLSQKRPLPRWTVITALGMSGLLLSHNAVSLMMIPVAGIYALCLLYFVATNRMKFLISVLLSVCWGFTLAAFFWVPALLEGKYTLRDIVTKGEALSRMVPMSWFIYSPWNYGGGNEFTKQIGIAGWFGVVMGIFVVFRERQRLIRIRLLGVIVLFIISLVFMTKNTSLIWENIKLLQNFQFPWRVLTISTFLAAVIAGIAISRFSKQQQKIFGVILCLSAIISTVMMWKPKAVHSYDESFFTGIYNSTTDTGESSPIWSVRFMEFRPEVPMEISEGNAAIVSQTRNTTQRQYQVSAQSKTRLVENTLYFPGWRIYVDGQEVPIEFQDPQWRGRMTFWVEPGEHTIRVLFGETKLRTIANIISIVSVIGLLPLFYVRKRI